MKPRNYLATGPMGDECARAALLALGKEVSATQPAVTTDAALARALGMTTQNWYNAQRTRPVAWSTVFRALATSGVNAHFRIYADSWYLVSG